MPKYEKVDAHTIKVITERATNIDLAGLIKGREQLIKQRDGINERLKEIDKVIKEAKKLGIIPKKEKCSLCKGIGQVGKNPDIPCPKCNTERHT